MTEFKVIAKMKEIMGQYYLEAKTTKTKKIAWVTSGAPVEPLYAMDVIPIYPENYAAMCAASHLSVECMEAAEAEGYSQDICAYARTDFGADILHGGAIPGGLPRPDFLVCSTNICKTVIKWYEVLARKFKVPLFVVDIPFLHDGLTPELTAYARAQILDLEDFLSDFLGRPFDRERLNQVLLNSWAATEYWKKFLDLAHNHPSPFNSLDSFIHLGPIVTLRGTPQCVEYYQALLAEVREAADQGRGSIPHERYRVLWDNLPIWYKTRRMSEFMAEHDTAMIAATYANSWGGLGQAAAQSQDPHERLAISYLYSYINIGFKERVEYLSHLIRGFDLTGFIMHSNRSCKPYSVGMYRLAEEVTALTGKPGVIIEACQNDPRVYSEAQIETRLAAFIESMEPVQ